MKKSAIRAYLARDRERVAVLKRNYHARRYRQTRGRSGQDAGRSLRQLARTVRPDWPTQRDRAEDLAHHVALKRLLDRAAHAFSAR
jgi:hypothetical protein